MRSILCLIAALVSSGCATLGAQTLPDVHAAYNESLAQTQNTQFLLNIVRARYREAPSFLDVASLTTQQSMVSSVGLNASVTTSPLGASPGANLGGVMSVTPTTTFLPLRGDDFVRRLVAPISLQTVAMVASSGWSIARVLQLTVDRINRITNAPTATGPTPEFPPELSRFMGVIRALRVMQLQEELTISMVRDQKLGDSGVLNFTNDSTDPFRTVHELLELKPGAMRIRLTEDFATEDSEALRVNLRSILGAIFYLSQGVDVPPEHEAKKLVTITRDVGGKRYDWQQMLDGVFRVRCSSSEPVDAAVKVRHRDTWFYIADDDLESKSTFVLLIQLFNMQAGRSALPMPLLTIPAGR